MISRLSRVNYRAVREDFTRKMQKPEQVFCRRKESNQGKELMGESER